MTAKDIRRWAKSCGISDPLLTEYLWDYKMSLMGSTLRNNLWILNGGPSDFTSLERTQALLTRTIEWRKAQRALITSRRAHIHQGVAKLIQQMYDSDDGATMTMVGLIADRRAKLKEFGSYTPDTPPAPPGAYLEQGDPLGRMSATEQQEVLRICTESYDEWSRRLPDEG